MKRTHVSLFVKFLIGGIGIIFISALPSLFIRGLHLEWSMYWGSIKDIIHSLTHLKDMEYDKYSYKGVTHFKVFPDYWSYFGYSFTIFASAFGSSLLAALILTYFTCLQPKRIIKFIVALLSFLESIPDLLIIAILDFMVLFIYQRTGVLLFNIAGAFERSYFIPILTLTILPSILFFRLLLLSVMDEENELYVGLAKSKGLSKGRIVLVHIYRNAIITLCTHIKSILFIILSNLVVVEYIFNIQGITRYILDRPEADVLALSILLFFIPVYCIMAIIRLFAENLTGREVTL